MSAGRILTLGLGTPFSAVKYLVTLGLGTAGVPASTRDTHDGIDEDSHRKVRESQAAKDKAFKSARERLREVLTQAWDGPQADAPVAAEVRAIAAPHVERLESGALRIDYESLAKHRRELLAFENALRAEFERRMAIEADDEDVMILAQWI